MKAIYKFLEALIDHIIGNPGVTKTQVNTRLASIIDNVNSSVSDQYIDGVAKVYKNCGIISTGSFTALRTDIIDRGADDSKAVLSALLRKIGESSDISEVNKALRQRLNNTYMAEIDLAISSLETSRDAESNSIVKEALEHGLKKLNKTKNSGRAPISIHMMNPSKRRNV